MGYTIDLNRRLKEHEQGRNRSTSPRRFFQLIHAELYGSKGDAMRREAYLKTAKGRRVLRLMLADYLSQADAGSTPIVD